MSPNLRCWQCHEKTGSKYGTHYKCAAFKVGDFVVYSKFYVLNIVYQVTEIRERGGRICIKPFSHGETFNSSFASRKFRKATDAEIARVVAAKLSGGILSGRHTDYVTGMTACERV